MTLTAARFDKKCGSSGIPDNATCTKRSTRARVETTTRKVGSKVKALTITASFFTKNKALRAGLSQAGAVASLAEAGATYSAGMRTGNEKLKNAAVGKAQTSTLALFRAAQTTQAYRKSLKATGLRAGRIKKMTAKKQRNWSGTASAGWSNLKDRDRKKELERMFKL